MWSEVFRHGPGGAGRGGRSLLLVQRDSTVTQSRNPAVHTGFVCTKQAHRRRD